MDDAPSPRSRNHESEHELLGRRLSTPKLFEKQRQALECLDVLMRPSYTHVCLQTPANTLAPSHRFRSHCLQSPTNESPSWPAVNPPVPQRQQVGREDSTGFRLRQRQGPRRDRTPRRGLDNSPGQAEADRSRCRVSRAGPFFEDFRREQPPMETRDWGSTDDKR